MKAMTGIKAGGTATFLKRRRPDTSVCTVKNRPTGCDKRANYVSGTLMATWPIHLCLSLACPPLFPTFAHLLQYF